MADFASLPAAESTYFAQLTASAGTLDIQLPNAESVGVFDFLIVARNSNGAVESDLFFRPNALATNLRSTASASDIYIGTMRGGGIAVIQGKMWCRTGSTRYLICNYGTVSGPAASGSNAGEWTDTTTPLTSARLVGTLDAGSKIMFWPSGARTR